MDDVIHPVPPETTGEMFAKLCDQHGWSYPGSPVVLVRLLFEKLSELSQQIDKEAVIRTQWIAELKEAVG